MGKQLLFTHKIYHDCECGWANREEVEICEKCGRELFFLKESTNPFTPDPIKSKWVYD